MISTTNWLHYSSDDPILVYLFPLVHLFAAPSAGRTNCFVVPRTRLDCAVDPQSAEHPVAELLSDCLRVYCGQEESKKWNPIAICVGTLAKPMRGILHGGHPIVIGLSFPLAYPL